MVAFESQNHTEIFHSSCTQQDIAPQASGFECQNFARIKTRVAAASLANFSAIGQVVVEWHASSYSMVCLAAPSIQISIHNGYRCLTMTEDFVTTIYVFHD